jgi:hypothetical protein
MLEDLFSAFASAGYDWDEFHVFRHPLNRRKYVVDHEGGCSCNSFEPPTLEQAEAMQPLGKREVYEEFSKWWDRTGYSDKSGTKIDNMERLRASL